MYMDFVTHLNKLNISGHVSTSFLHNEFKEFDRQLSVSHKAWLTVESIQIKINLHQYLTQTTKSKLNPKLCSSFREESFTYDALFACPLY